MTGAANEALEPDDRDIASSDQPRAPGRWIALLQIFLVFVSLQVGGAAGLFLLDLEPFYAGAMGMAAALLVATFFLRREGKSWADIGLRAPADRGVVARATIRTIAVILFGLTGLGVYLIALGAEPPEPPAFLQFEGDLGHYLLMVVLVAWGLAAFGEEMFARGFLMSRLEMVFSGTRAPIQLALVAQALIFGLMHLYQGVLGAVIVTLAALFLGIAYLRCKRNLWAPIISHGVIDTVGFTLIYFGVSLPVTG